MRYEGFRLHENAVETPVFTFENPHTGSSIGFVSMLHIGDPSYYRSLRNHAEERRNAGAIIHYESPTQIPPQDRTPITEEYQDLYDELTVADGSFYEPINKLLGTVRAVDELDAPGQWIASGLSPDKITQLLGKTLTRSLIDRANARSEELSNKPSGELVKIIRGYYHPLVSRIRHRPLPAAKELWAHQDRHELGSIDEVLAANAAQDIELLYQPEHLRGISRGLRARDYTLRRKKQWYKAFSLASSAV